MIETCPRCGYSLQGLPADHSCPECGLRYDAESAIYRHLYPAAVFGFLGGGFAWFWGAINLFHAYHQVPKPWQAVILLCWLIFVVFTAAAGRYCYRLYKKGLLVAVLPEGLYLRLQKLDGEFIPWSNIARAAANKGVKSVALFIRDSRTVRDVTGVFRSPGEVERFAEQVNARTRPAEGAASNHDSRD